MKKRHIILFAIISLGFWIISCDNIKSVKSKSQNKKETNPKAVILTNPSDLISMSSYFIDDFQPYANFRYDVENDPSILFDSLNFIVSLPEGVALEEQPSSNLAPIQTGDSLTFIFHAIQAVPITTNASIYSGSIAVPKDYISGASQAGYGIYSHYLIRIINEEGVELGKTVIHHAYNDVHNLDSNIDSSIRKIHIQATRKPHNHNYNPEPRSIKLHIFRKFIKNGPAVKIDYGTDQRNPKPNISK